MSRSYNDIDDFMQIALYMLPKYMRRIERYRRHYNDHGEPDNHFKREKHSHGYHEDPLIDRKKLFDFLEKNFLSEKDIDSKNKKREVKQDKKVSKKDNKISNKAADGSLVKDKKDAKVKETSAKKDCHNYISQFLSGFYNQYIDISFKYPSVNTMENVFLIYADDNVLRIRDSQNQIFVLPVWNISAIYLKNSSFKEYNTKHTHVEIISMENYMEKYFNSHIGKKISIETINQGKFKFIKECIVKKVYDRFVLFDNNIIISFSSIILIKEDLDNHTI
ncbi:hypothetical protein [Clostridium tyrobutyricum]|uniref:hypothetical protein n=1 Tax=Clostridium tyrobutyricum TaxID=1519 RepID=UPI00057E0BFA|nr:hypothetical protein [Clostridium tyrobutyricum]MBV4414837.1 hypothetical protein [Clostridium tyrobutyricum]MBV4420698.1 hypothetical protein [Clostridium tyrobutyricum]MBV4423809.1 hypothetical protein [Clostridium tyrobutyricum]